MQCRQVTIEYQRAQAKSLVEYFRSQQEEVAAEKNKCALELQPVGKRCTRCLQTQCAWLAGKEGQASLVCGVHVSWALYCCWHAWRHGITSGTLLQGVWIHKEE